MRRAAAAAVRRLQSRFDQPGRLRHRVRRHRLGAPPPGGAPHHALPRERDRRQQLSRCPKSPSWPSASAASASASWGWPTSSSALACPTIPTEAVDLGRELQQFVDDEAKNESERLATLRGVFPEWERSIWGPDATCARDAARQPDPPDAQAAQLQRHHRGADRHDLDHRRLLVGDRAALRRGVHAQPGRRADARRQRRLRGHRPPGRVVHRRPDAAHRRSTATSTSTKCRRSGSGCSSPPTRSRPSGTSACRRRSRSTTTRRSPRRATLPMKPLRGVRRADLPPGLRSRLQGRHGLSRRVPRHAGALHRHHRPEGGRTGHQQRQVGGARRPRRRSLRPRPPSTNAASPRPTWPRSSPKPKPRIVRLHQLVHELESENLQRRQKRSRPELLRGATRRIATPLGDLYVTITEDDKGQPFEVFMSLGKAGGALMADVEAIGRLISLGVALRHSAQGDPPPAARHLLRSRHRPRVPTR